LQNAERDLDRLKQLFEKTLVTAQELDAAQARVAERRGALAANEAQVEDARLQLAYTSIEAPIDGRLGLRQFDPGNLIRPGDSSGLVVITQTQPISVVFTIPEVDLQKVLEPLRSGKELAVEAWDRNEQHLVETGVLRTVDNQINIATGTVRLKAEFSNADEILFPNQFVNVRLRVNTVENAIVIPADAVQFGSRGTYVYVVDAKSRSIIHDVVLGPSDGTWQAVTQGVTVGDQVVLEGLDRLREGRPVKIVNDTPEPTPTRSRAKSS
ncbi:MAG TPA: efflux RND transporter periplasmic adaptor subunit, partial [Opitutaceae bacterium]|nr:efflux RND transporter periplasmic adaptor subunit [Opitutaceae bacterium]